MLRPARPQRRRQDDDHRDPRGPDRPRTRARSRSSAAAGASHERELRERLGISLQESRLTEKLTVFETLELFRSFYARGRDPEQLMADLSLEEKRDARVGKLSGGQRQRLAVACALAGDPEILFLDEPTTGLDPQSRLQLWERIAAYKAAGRTVLLTTHYMEEAERLCDRVAVVDHGKIIAQGSPAELIAGLHAPAHHRVLDRARRRRTTLLAQIPGIGERRQRDGRWLLARRVARRRPCRRCSPRSTAPARGSCRSRRTARRSRTSSSR